MGIGTPSIHNKIPRPITFSCRQYPKRRTRKTAASAADTNAQEGQKVHGIEDAISAIGSSAWVRRSTQSERISLARNARSGLMAPRALQFTPYMRAASGDGYTRALRCARLPLGCGESSCLLLPEDQ